MQPYPYNTLNKEKYEVVDALVKRMGLGKAADTIVGDEKVGFVSLLAYGNRPPILPLSTVFN